MVDSAIMSRRALLLCPVLVALTLIGTGAPAAGADSPALADRWKSDQGVPPSMRKVLVVGITPDVQARRRFEDRVVTLLRARGVEAITGYSIVPDLGAERDTAAVLGALFGQRVEGVITVRLRPLDDKTKEEERAAAWRASMEEPEKARDYVDAALRDFVVEAKELGAEAAYWSMDDGRRIWAGRFPGASIKRLRKQAAQMCQAVIDDMRFVGLF
jgi:hypothetical protein